MEKLVPNICLAGTDSITGYGFHTTGLLSALVRQVYLMRFLIRNQGQTPPTSSYPGGIEQASLLGRTFATDEEQILIHIWFLKDLHPSSSCYGNVEFSKLVGFPVFEHTKFSTEEINGVKATDLLFVTSTWGKRVVEDNLRGSYYCPEIYIVPEGVTPSISLDEKEKGLSKPRAISVGKYEERKGQRDLIRTLGMDPPDLEVIAYWHNLFDPSWRNTASNDLRKSGFSFEYAPVDKDMGVFRKGKCLVRLLPWSPSKSDLLKAMQDSDFGIYPYRSEGWGLPVLETIAQGTPVIATDYSAPCDYLSSNNAILIEGEMVDIPQTRFHRPNSGQWMKVDPASIHEGIEKMLNLLPSNSTNSRYEEMSQSGIETGAQYSWENAGLKTIEALKNAGFVRERDNNVRSA